ncbi:MAG: hypothetical protein PHY31_09100 [Smithellaceae bacterium]|nr:hypothetical protein [Smithellaceae bacterium]
MDKKKSDCRDDRDRRIVAQKILRGEMAEKDLREYLSDLPDCSENAETISVNIKER